MGEATEYYKNETQSQIIAKLQAYKSKAQALYDEIDTKEKQYQKEQEKQITLFNQMQKYTDASSLARQQLLAAREELGLTAAYLEGYKFLNEIGHYFNGQWQYSLTISSQGEMLTFNMSEEQFLKLGEAHLGGFKIMTGKTSILQQMKDSQITAIKWDGSNQDERYNQQIYDNYMNIVNYAKGVTEHAKNPVAIANYNKGQILEGYFAYGETHNNIASHLAELSAQVDLAKEHHLGNRYRALHNALQEIANELHAQTNARGFWTGGDTRGQGQIKGEGASIFSYSTIKNQLLKFTQITEQLNFTELEQAINNAKPEIKAALQRNVDNIINMVMAQFNATVGNSTVQGEINELANEIDAIINSLI